MSFLFGGKPQLSSAEKIAAAELEVEMVSDMLNRYVWIKLFLLTNTNPPFWQSLNQSCSKKCIPADYREAELNKGESVCLDRCVSKFFDVNMKVSEKMQGDAAVKQGGQGGGGFGM